MREPISLFAVILLNVFQPSLLCSSHELWKFRSAYYLLSLVHLKKWLQYWASTNFKRWHTHTRFVAWIHTLCSASDGSCVWTDLTRYVRRLQPQCWTPSCSRMVSRCKWWTHDPSLHDTDIHLEWTQNIYEHVYNMYAAPKRFSDQSVDILSKLLCGRWGATASVGKNAQQVCFVITCACL